MEIIRHEWFVRTSSSKFPLYTDPCMAIIRHLMLAIFPLSYMAKHLESTPLSTTRTLRDFLVTWHLLPKYIAFNLAHLAYLHGSKHYAAHT